MNSREAEVFEEDQRKRQPTPGPWIARAPTYSDVPPHVVRILRDDQQRKCTTYVADCQHAADARLIAAAPDMLAALKAIARDSIDEFSQDCARAAIKKATHCE